MVKLQAASHLSEPLAIPYRHAFLEEDGWVATPELGKVYLEPSLVYDCTVLSEQYVQFQSSMEEAVFFTGDLQKLVRQGDLVITYPDRDS